MAHPWGVRLIFPLVLASGSPRRVELLKRLVPEFDVVVAGEVEESHDPALSPAELTEHNARLKAVAVAASHPGRLVLGADTLVYLDGEPLGKPATEEEAASMLRRLSGRSHTVCTGVCLAGPDVGMVECFHDLTEVRFRRLEEPTIAEYLSKVFVLDKAGAYAIQECGEMIVEGIRGSLSIVIGLPVEALEKHLRRRSADPAPPVH